MSGPPPYPPPPQPSGNAMSPNEERNWAMAAHLGVLIAAWVALGLLAPLIVLLVFGERSAFVKRHATESLNFQISLLIYIFVAGVAAVLTIGLALLIIVPLGLAVAVLALVTVIMGGMAASRGEEFRYPLCIRLIS